MRKQCSRLVGDDRHVVVFTGKLTDRIQGIKGHDRDEFCASFDLATKELNAPKPVNAPILNTNKDFLLEQCLILVCVA